MLLGISTCAASWVQLTDDVTACGKALDYFIFLYRPNKILLDDISYDISRLVIFVIPQGNPLVALRVINMRESA